MCFGAVKTVFASPSNQSKTLAGGSVDLLFIVGIFVPQIDLYAFKQIIKHSADLCVLTSILSPNLLD